MSFDTILRNARIAGREHEPVDIAMRDGRIAAIGPRLNHAARPAKLMNLRDYGIAVGNPADMVVLDCADRVAAVSELAQPLLVMKRGRISVSRPAASINWPIETPSLTRDDFGGGSLAEARSLTRSLP
jgi:cytosine/adenosine deaminase-related metal-dependent hydrolase